MTPENHLKKGLDFGKQFRMYHMSERFINTKMWSVFFIISKLFLWNIVLLALNDSFKNLKFSSNHRIFSSFKNNIHPRASLLQALMSLRMEFCRGSLKSLFLSGVSVNHLLEKGEMKEWMVCRLDTKELNQLNSCTSDATVSLGALIKKVIRHLEMKAECAWWSAQLREQIKLIMRWNIIFQLSWASSTVVQC